MIMGLAAARTVSAFRVSVFTELIYTWIVSGLLRTMVSLESAIPVSDFVRKSAPPEVDGARFESWLARTATESGLVRATSLEEVGTPGAEAGLCNTVCLAGMLSNGII